MEALFIYLLKSSALIAVFYLAYHFLVRKETFFNSNRWFLLSGLFTSALLPLFFIKKFVLVERPKISSGDMAAYSQQYAQAPQDIPVVEAFDWMQLFWVSYIIIAGLLAIRIILNFTSLYRMLYQQQVIRKEQFKLVNLNQNIAPFSFFNYIVYNPDLYSDEELQSILLHEKIHSKEKHSMDILIAKLFCIAFWFNPFVWLYKKAITQNLEYIADQKAIGQLEDKKSYQRALLKVVSNQSCLPITNNFYQSLIKKRIVMLNKNQSHKRNSIKYAIIIPALICFIIFFQVQIIAREKLENNAIGRLSNDNHIRLVIDKNTTDAELKEYTAMMKEEGISLKSSKVKRNNAGEIIGIKLDFKDQNGNKGSSHVNGTEPIKPIQFYKNNSGVGFGSPKQVKVFTHSTNSENEDATSITIDDSTDVADSFNFDFNMDFDAPEPPEAPEVPEFPEMPEAPEAPETPQLRKWSNNTNTNVVIKTDGDKKPIVIINGKKITDDKEIEEAMKKYGRGSLAYSSTGSHVYVNGQDVMKISRDAMANARVQMEKSRSDMSRQRKSMSADQLRMKVEMEKARNNIRWADNDLKTDVAKSMEAAKAEMQQAKEEMLKAKAEYEKAKAELKTTK